LAEFSTLEVAACHAMHFQHSIAIQPNLELKTRAKQVLGSLPLDIALPDVSYKSFHVKKTVAICGKLGWNSHNFLR